MDKNKEFIDLLKKNIKKNGKYCGEIKRGKYEICPYYSCNCAGIYWCKLIQLLYKRIDITNRKVFLHPHLRYLKEFRETPKEKRLVRVKDCIKYFGEE
jgi:hypothetical protein